MKAKALGRFVADFLEGMSGGKDSPEEAVAAPAAPAVIPVETVREAVTPMIRQIVVEMLQQAMAGEEDPPPSGQQLDMVFADAGGRAAVDPIAEMTIRRVTEMRVAQEEKERRERFGEQVPEAFDPNAPGDKPWMGARLNPETVNQNTA